LKYRRIDGQGFGSVKGPFTIGHPAYNDIPRVGDFNGDKIEDIAMFRSTSKAIEWYIYYAGPDGFEAGSSGITFGNPGYINFPLVGNFGGTKTSDGRDCDDLVIWRYNAAYRGFYIRYSLCEPWQFEGGDTFVGLGNSGYPQEFPMISDWNSDGLHDVSIYRPGQTRESSRVLIRLAQFEKGTFADSDDEKNGIGGPLEVDSASEIAQFEQLATKNPIDIDHDGVADHLDNCPFAWNPQQIDQDLDGKGDECDDYPHDQRK
jgi:hypothetical protein